MTAPNAPAEVSVSTTRRNSRRFLPTHKRRWRHPNETDDNRLVYAIAETVLDYAARNYAHGRLVDIGCGEKPFAPIFAPYVSEHIGVDHPDTPHGVTAVDIMATASDVPLPSVHADTILMSAVLEHLERPGDALSECYRLLKPGGHLILTAPFIWPIHEAPRDFFRYSPYGLQYLLEAAGFEVVEVQPYAGAWTTLALEISYALRKHRRGPATPLVSLTCRALQKLLSSLDRVDYQPRFSWAHLAVGRRSDHVSFPRTFEAPNELSGRTEQIALLAGEATP
jgi:SAM-dependent methyltransferase